MHHVTQDDVRAVNKLQHSLRNVVLDWVLLRTTLPSPSPPETSRRSTQHVFGHPAEWTSMKLTDIADILHSWHEALTEHLEDTPPPTHASELATVRNAWTYLCPRTDQLFDYAGEDVTIELNEIHRSITTTLGYRTPRIMLPIPCPSCEHKTLTRHAGIADRITCINPECTWSITETMYPFFIHMTLESMIG